MIFARRHEDDYDHHPLLLFSLLQREPAHLYMETNKKVHLSKRKKQFFSVLHTTITIILGANDEEPLENGTSGVLVIASRVVYY